MKFFQVLGYATLALALPSPVPLEENFAVEGLEKRSAIAAAVPGIINTLSGTVASNFASINQAINQIKATNNVALVVQLTSQINTNYQAILDALNTAGTQVTASTTGAVGGVLGSLQGLTKDEAAQILDAINKAVAALKGIQATFNLTGNSGVASIKTAVQDEITAIQNTVTSLTKPLVYLATGLSLSSLSGAATITGVPAAIQSLFDIATSLLNNA